MPVTVVVGAQWGDEGKAKIIDLLSKEHTYVVRYQGGHNAGHTVVIGDQNGGQGHRWNGTFPSVGLAPGNGPARTIYCSPDASTRTGK